MPTIKPICMGCHKEEGHNYIALCSFHALTQELLELCRDLLEKGVTEDLMERAEEIFTKMEEEISPQKEKED